MGENLPPKWRICSFICRVTRLRDNTHRNNNKSARREIGQLSLSFSASGAELGSGKDPPLTEKFHKELRIQIFWDWRTILNKWVKGKKMSIKALQKMQIKFSVLKFARESKSDKRNVCPQVHIWAERSETKGFEFSISVVKDLIQVKERRFIDSVSGLSVHSCLTLLLWIFGSSLYQEGHVGWRGSIYLMGSLQAKEDKGGVGSLLSP